MGPFRVRSVCTACGGGGKVVKDRCKTCDGQGRTRVSVKLKVAVPAGVDSGMQIRLRSKGDVGDPGGPPGDLFVTVQVRKHEFFEREDVHVLCTVPVAYPTACLGGEVTFPTIDGDTTLPVPAGTPSGKVFTLHGKGIPSLNGRGRGDQLVQVVVAVPKSLSTREEELLRELAKVQDAKVEEASGGIAGFFKGLMG